MVACSHFFIFIIFMVLYMTYCHTPKRLLIIYRWSVIGILDYFHVQYFVFYVSKLKMITNKINYSYLCRLSLSWLTGVISKLVLKGTGKEEKHCFWGVSLTLLTTVSVQYCQTEYPQKHWIVVFTGTYVIGICIAS